MLNEIKRLSPWDLYHMPRAVSCPSHTSAHLGKFLHMYSGAVPTDFPETAHLPGVWEYPEPRQTHLQKIK